MSFWRTRWLAACLWAACCIPGLVHAQAPAPHYFFCVDHPDPKLSPQMSTIFVYVPTGQDSFQPDLNYRYRKRAQELPNWAHKGWCRGGKTLEDAQAQWALYYIGGGWTANSDEGFWYTNLNISRVRPDPLEDKQLLDRLVRQAKAKKGVKAADQQAKGGLSEAAAKAQPALNQDVKNQVGAALKSSGAALTIDDSYAREQAKFRKEHEARMAVGAKRDAEAKARADAATAALKAQQDKEIADRKARVRPCEKPGCASKQ